MKNLSHLLKSTLLLAIFLIAMSCAEEEAPKPNELTEAESVSGNSYINYIGVKLKVGPNFNGDVIIEIRNEDGSTILASKTVSGSILPAGNHWRTFYMGNNAIAESGEKYRLCIRRTGSHDALGGDYLQWRSVYRWNDPKPNLQSGDSEFGNTNEWDFTFRAYKDFVLNQWMEQDEMAYSVGSENYWFQEFTLD